MRMKKKALRKEFYMEVRRTWNRFLSLLLITALGVAFFSGIRAAQPDMELSADRYYQETQLMDVSVQGTLGVTEEDVEKINIFLADLKDREPLCRELEQEPDLVITSSLYNNLEINASSATKGRALMWLADYLKIDREATMALGDGGNDLSMIQAAGIGVAMVNGLEEVKAAADFITMSNDEDGVAAAVEKFVLNSKGK